MAMNDPEMQRMQQDAIRRVRDMQSRAQQTLNRTEGKDVPHPQEHAEHRDHRNHREPPPAQTPMHHPAAPEPPAETDAPLAHRENPITDLFNGLLADSERTLILVLILLLISEKADTYLIFALMYLVI